MIIPAPCHRLSLFDFLFAAQKYRLAATKFPGLNISYPPFKTQLHFSVKIRFRRCFSYLGNRIYQTQRFSGWGGNRLREIRKKLGLPTVPIGNFGVRPKTRCPGVNPSYCCTCELRCKAVIAENSFHSLFDKQFDLRLPIIWSIIPLKCACRLSVAPKL